MAALIFFFKMSQFDNVLLVAEHLFAERQHYILFSSSLCKALTGQEKKM